MIDHEEHLQNKIDQAERELVRKDRAISEAISELRRWQYSEEPTDVQHSIDMAIRTLEQA